MKLVKILLFSFASISIISCASHSTMRGSVVMKMSADTAHVCLGSGEVKAGDRVAAYKHICKNDETGSSSRSKVSSSCVKEKIGNGVVVQTLNDHYSEVKFDSGVPFDEGTTVEKE